MSVTGGGNSTQAIGYNTGQLSKCGNRDWYVHKQKETEKGL